jgi:Major tropism determinant N-terminal domain
MPANALIRIRRDSTANWEAEDPVLAEGEPGLETDTGKLKLGDGISAWTLLSYAGGLVDLSIYVDALVPAGARLMRFKSQRALTLVESDTLLDAEVASSASKVFQLKKNGANNGTITVAASATGGIVSISDGHIPAGTVLELFAPAVQDATLADVTITIAAIR